MNRSFRHPLRYLPSLLLCITLALPVLAHAGAGKVIFVSGKVSAQNKTAGTRLLQKDSELESDDLIDTGSGQVQIRFSDGAFIALTPNTQFKIERYRFNGKNDGEEQGFFRLLKGGFRTISGLIGKANNEAYRVSTPTATIGIRGTAYRAMQAEDTLEVTVNQGRVAVSSAQGTIEIPAGKHLLIEPNKPLELKDNLALTTAATNPNPVNNKPADLPRLAKTVVPEPTKPPQPTPRPTLPPLPTPIPQHTLSDGTGYQLRYTAPTTGVIGSDTGTATFTHGARLDTLQATTTYDHGSTDIIDTHTDGTLGWGRWVSGTATVAGTTTVLNHHGLSYIIGIPTPTTNLPSSGNASYTVTGTTGDLNGNIMVGFGPSAYTFKADLTTTNGYTLYSTVGSVNTISSVGPSHGSNFYFSDTVLRNGTACTTTACTASFNGFFSGPHAEKIGIGYEFVDPAAAAVVARGTAALTR